MPTTKPLHKTEDWTISGDTLTFLVAPQDNKRVVAHYSYQDPTAPGASNGHTHIREQKSSWPNPTTTWQLTHTPEIATTPTVGQMLVFAEDQGGNFLWVAYRNQPATDLAIRNMELNPDGTFLQWACPEIIGFDDVAGERGTALCAHPTDPHIVYFATYANDTRIRIYRSADWATVTKVADITQAALGPNQNTRTCVRIYVEQGSTNVWFMIGSRGSASNSPAPAYDAGSDGLWGASDGITFTKRGFIPASIDIGWGIGVNAVELWVKENAPRKIFAFYHHRGWAADPNIQEMGFAVSSDGGVNWTKTDLSVSLAPSPYFPLPSLATLQGFPPLSGDTNLRLSIQEAAVSFQRLHPYSSVDGGANWTDLGPNPAGASGWEATDAAFFFHDPTILLHLGSAIHGLAGASARSTDGGDNFTNYSLDDREGIQGESYRQITVHWTLPWAVTGFHTGPVPGTGPWNDIYITTDAGVTTPWARLTEAAGFDTANLLIHGVAFVQNNSKS